MALVKVYSGSEIMAQAVRQLLEDSGIAVRVRDHIESGRLAGFVALDVDLFVEGDDVIRANNIIENFLKQDS